jgi:hypothetical protein
MAFKNRSENVREIKQPDFYLNQFIPRADGSAMRLESTKLYLDNPSHKQLIDGWNAGTITQVDLCGDGAIQCEIRSAARSEAGLVLKKALIG